jgi:hypothetical protein
MSNQVKSCHSCQIMSFMSNHIIHVKSCHSCQIMSFMSNHVIHLKSCQSCQIMSFMSNHVIHVKTCYSCHIMLFISNHVIDHKSCLHLRTKISAGWVGIIADSRPSASALLTGRRQKQISFILLCPHPTGLDSVGVTRTDLELVCPSF